MAANLGLDNIALSYELETLRDQGCSQKQAAQKLNISLKHVQTLSALYQLKWPKRTHLQKVSFPAKVLVLAAIELGLPKARMARVVGVHHSAVIRWEKRSELY
jgi:DNA-binding XRE family transcriptional regulator